MMKLRHILLCAAMLWLIPVSAQLRDGASYEDLYDGETVSALKRHVRELSAASLEGRKAGSEGEAAAAEYIASVLEQYEVDVISPEEGDVFGILSDKGDTLTSRNVMGIVSGYDKKLRDQYVVVGARMDGPGTMTVTIDGKPVDRIFYGANGNASGVSILLELARKVKTNAILFRRSVAFVAFGSSSQTYAGSWYFLNRSFPASGSIDAMINLDMLGTGYNGFYAYTSSNADMNSLLNTLSGELQPVLPELTSAEPYPSDHRTFYAGKIPSVWFTTGRYPEHGTDRDTQSIIDYEMMERELEYIFNFTVALANLPYAPAFSTDEVNEKPSGKGGVVPYYECDVRPLFFGSPDPKSFISQWVYKYLKYPESAVRDGVQGTVHVEMVIEKDGKVSEVKVVRSVSEELDAEAIRVVSASPKWTPGKVDGNKVRSSLTIPVEFRLERKARK
ncbi:MAG: TonB family protein [Bacteroidales bacterium]|nr:TonB family protein [Bacteroidales bacterium]